MNKFSTNRNSLNRYMIIPVIMSVVMVILTAIMLTISIKAAFLCMMVAIVFIGICLYGFLVLRKEILEDIVNYSMDMDIVQKKTVKHLPIPYAMTDQSGFIVWSNEEFAKLAGQNGKKMNMINDIFPELGKKVMDTEVDRLTRQIHVKMKVNARTDEVSTTTYRVEIRRVRLQETITDENGEFTTEELRRINDENAMLIFYFFDETIIRRFRRQIDKQKLVAGLIYIDNYEEVLEKSDEVKHSMLTTLVDRRINKTISNLDGIVKKIEKDKYLVFFQQKYLEKLIDTKFGILDDIKNINVGNEMAMTLSIAIAAGQDSYSEAYENASQMMDLALGRGGDQAVVKNGEDISYYGGKSQAVEKNTRVKARVKAHALTEIMESRERIFIMGHKIPDTDSVGAAIGIYRMAKSLGKQVYIVLDEESISVRQLLAKVKADKEYDPDMFIGSERALSQAKDKECLLVVVDVNRPSYTECPELLKKLHSVVVIDHHRQMQDTIKHATLSYIEPYASSACELVAEILQYVNTKPKLRMVEADAMYSGILIDTNNFVVQTGVRTFEAAAFLRRNGADVTRVRKIFRDDLETYQLRARAVGNSVLFDRFYAISSLNGNSIDSPSVLGAQVANELLDIEGIRASFVLTLVGDTVFISARSIDEVNVAVIMEKLGGGGHMTVAGAQLKNRTLSQAREELENLLLRMKQEGEL
ncbi:MAG: DHH family phosphoesterase [Lachnospiraceae bacterium]|nr:DHH family phosphoesterase [Lachnospiraceae bacterium]